jgi:N-methylhydantoinase A
VGVDVGGTFTDLVVIDAGEVSVAKVPSTPADPSVGVMAALCRAGVEADGVAVIAHGTTVATNALLERRGGRTALLTTEGFRDVIEIGRQARPSLYDLTCAPPAPLVARQHRFTVRERVGPGGELVPLDQDQLVTAIEEIRRCEVEAVAVCFLFSFLDPSHERGAAEALRAALPGTRVSLSSEVLPELREFERFSTTIADAYLAPVLSDYLTTLGGRLRQARYPAPLVMQSSGGVLDLEGVVGRPSACVLSGPAGGVVGAAFAADASGHRNLLTFDMGGTSTDVALVVDGEVQSTTSAVVAGVPVKHTMVDVHTISAGGGSLVWADSGGALRAGPRSAGADPGPACYGLGGTAAAVTDADLYLGYLSDGGRLGGEIVLDRSCAERALADAGSHLGLSPLGTAAGAVTVAEAEMVRALRVVSVSRGLDPRDFTLVAFGGAGGLHACNLAAELGMRTVLVPRAAGALSALGLAVSDLRRDLAAALFSPLADLQPAAWENAFAALEHRARSELAGPRLRRSADLRYRGQSFELTVPAASLPGLGPAFAAAHRRRYGFDLPGEEVQLVSVRVAATVPVPKPALPAVTTTTAEAARVQPAHFGGTWVEVPVYRLGADVGLRGRVRGPAIVELPGATCAIPPGWAVGTDDAGALVLEMA